MPPRSTPPKQQRPHCIVALTRSRKFWLAVAGVLIPVINRKLGLGLEPVEIGSVLAVIVATILGIAGEDAMEKKGKEPNERG